MRCPYCGVDDDRVIDSRTSEGGRVVRRRRQCDVCRKRFTTYERIDEAVKLAVVKRDGTRVPYDRNKIMAGVQRSCWKRPVSREQLEKLVDDVEEEVFSRFDREVSSRFIGERVVQKLRQLDKVAYVRFASVYHKFRDVGQFIEEARGVIESAQRDSPGQGQLFGDAQGESGGPDGGAGPS